MCIIKLTQKMLETIKSSRRENITSLLASVLGVPGLRSELSKALTHSSFYTDENDDRSNSRFIFEGMYSFKGEVAGIASHLIPGTGRQLQNFLGNIFSGHRLNRIFDRYMLASLCRYGKGFDLEKNKHVMVLGLLGFIIEYSPEKKLHRFILKNFFEGNSHLFPGYTRNRDLLAQLTYFCRICHNCNPVIKTELKDEKYTTLVYVRESEISRSESLGYRYSRKRAMKTAIIALSAPLGEEFLKDDAFLEREAMREKAEKEKLLKQKLAKAEMYQEKKQKLAAIRAEKRTERRRHAIEQEIMRRRAKMKAKAREESMQKKAEKEQEAMARMSANKRRHLQDKQK